MLSVKDIIAILQLIISPKKYASKKAEEVIRQYSSQINDPDQIRRNWKRDALEFRAVIFNAIVLFSTIIVFAASLCWIIAYQKIIIPPRVLLVLRMLSGFLIFISVFGRVVDKDYLAGKSEIEILNAKLWKLLYLAGMGIMVFTYIWEMPKL